MVKKKATKPKADKTKPMKPKKTDTKIQEFLPTMAPEKNERVHKLALKFHECQKDAGSASWAELEAKNTLISAMKEEGLTTYRYGELFVNLSTTDKVKVKVEADK